MMTEWLMDLLFQFAWQMTGMWLAKYARAMRRRWQWLPVARYLFEIATSCYIVCQPMVGLWLGEGAAPNVSDIDTTVWLSEVWTLWSQSRRVFEWCSRMLERSARSQYNPGSHPHKADSRCMNAIWRG
jgi:hypothetical protein